MNSERSRLSGSALDLVTTLSAGLGPAFDPLIALFMPIENTRLSSILYYLTESVHNKSTSLRLAALEGILTCLNYFDPPDDTCVSLLEETIKLTARDVSIDAKRAGEKLVEACNGMESFRPATKKYSATQGAGASRSISPSLPRRCPTTEKARLPGSSTGKGTRRTPSVSTSTTQSTNQRVVIRTAPSLRAVSAEMKRTIVKTRPPSVEPSSVASLPKPTTSQRDPKQKPVVAKIYPFNSTSIATVKLFSRTGSQSLMKVEEHLVTRARRTNSRIIQLRSDGRQNRL